MKTLKNLSVRELRDTYTTEDIINILKSNGVYINQVTEKGESLYGMYAVINKEKALNYFNNPVLALHYFLEMNWI